MDLLHLYISYPFQQSGSIYGVRACVGMEVHMYGVLVVIHTLHRHVVRGRQRGEMWLA